MEPFLHFVLPLNEAGFDYLVTGSIAAMLYGEPRLTNDVALILYLSKEQTRNLFDAFPAKDFYCPPDEVLKIEATRSVDGHFNLIHHETGFKADVYLAGNDALMAWALDNRRELFFEGVSVSLAPPEYVIVRKLEYFRAGGSEKHIRDIKAMLEVSRGKIDYDAVRKNASSLGLLSEWERVCDE